MKYYKIKREYGNKKRSDGSILVQDELYTEKEKEYFHIPKVFCEVVEVSKRKIYWVFGARFGIED